MGVQEQSCYHQEPWSLGSAAERPVGGELPSLEDLTAGRTSVLLHAPSTASSCVTLIMTGGGLGGPCSGDFCGGSRLDSIISLERILDGLLLNACYITGRSPYECLITQRSGSGTGRERRALSGIKVCHVGSDC
ncbi:unnamed protein product [Penicillium bialowiezense]